MIVLFFCVLLEFVIVFGIELFNSFFIIIMVLEDDVLRMLNLLLVLLIVFFEMFVNSVMVNEKIILILGIIKLFYIKFCLFYFIFKNRYNCFFFLKYYIFLF